ALGAEVATVLSADGASAQGVGVVTITGGGPADRAGLRAGDVIKSAGSAGSPDTAALAAALAGARPGDKVRLTISRGAQGPDRPGDARRTARGLTDGGFAPCRTRRGAAGQADQPISDSSAG
ncbi:MAG: PDZ domain-containing protein, partial [Streptosporangiaceae bacterium]